MTPTTSEREARELLARALEAAGRAWEAPGIRQGENMLMRSEIALDALLAALTREQREGVCLPDSIIGELHEVLTNVDTQFRATGQPSARIERAINLLAGLRNKPQQEAPGAVAWACMDGERMMRVSHSREEMQLQAHGRGWTVEPLGLLAARLGVVQELLTNIKRSCIRGRNVANMETEKNFVATCDHVENLADEALHELQAALGGEGGG